MTAKTKTVNYTDHMAGLLMNGYTGTDNVKEVAELAEVTGKSENSVRAKLNSMGLYVKETKANTAKGVTKDQIVGSIGTMVKLTQADIEGLTKSTKNALIKVHNALQSAQRAVKAETETETE
jgi:hypothetical protein